MSVRYSYAQAQPLPQHSLPRTSDFTSGWNSKPYSRSARKQEDAVSRDLRIFGGLEGEPELSSDLRGPMLDVVLGLFNGMDYDDASW